MVPETYGGAHHKLNPIGFFHKSLFDQIMHVVKIPGIEYFKFRFNIIFFHQLGNTFRLSGSH